MNPLRSCNSIARSGAALAIGLLSALSLCGKVENPPYGVWLDIRVHAQANILYAYGHFMPPMPTTSDTFYHTGDMGWYGGPWPADFWPGLIGPGPVHTSGAPVAVGRSYPLVVQNSGSGSVVVSPPPGYRVLLNGQETSQT